MKRLLGCAAAIIVVGCGTDPNAIEDTFVPGTVAFDFTGAGTSGSTRFDATGGVSYTHPEWGTSPMAAAQLNTSTPIHTLIAGGIPRSSTMWDQILLDVNRVTVGSATIPTPCSGPAVFCIAPSIQVEFNANHASSLDSPAYVCIISSGTITITSSSDGRVAGTFSGTGLCTTSSNAQAPFTITNGVFDVGMPASGKPLPRA